MNKQKWYHTCGFISVWMKANNSALLPLEWQQTLESLDLTVDLEVKNKEAKNLFLELEAKVETQEAKSEVTKSSGKNQEAHKDRVDKDKGQVAKDNKGQEVTRDIWEKKTQKNSLSLMMKMKNMMRMRIQNKMKKKRAPMMMTMILIKNIYLVVKINNRLNKINHRVEVETLNN